MSQLVNDLERTVADAVAALRTAVDRDWGVPASGLSWSCRGTVEHVSDDLFAYAAQIAVRAPAVTTDLPFARSAEPDGDEQTIHTDRAAGNAGVVEVLDCCGGLLSAVARTRGSDVRGYHAYGVSDPDGFAAMGTVEVLLHLYDVAVPLGLTWQPDPEVVRRATARLFPESPTDGDAWATLLETTGRGGAGAPAVLDWRWDGRVGD
jgi:hypothetical protein